MAQAKKKETRQEIVEAAIECYATQGVGMTKMSDIARELGMAQAHLKYHFDDFTTLFRAVVEHIREDLQKVSAEPQERLPEEPLKALEAYLRATLYWGKKKPKFFRLWLYFYHEASYREEFAELNQEGRKRGRERIAFFLYQAIEKKLLVLRPGDSVKNLAVSIQSVLTGYTICAATEPDTDYAHLEKLLLGDVRRLITGG